MVKFRVVIPARYASTRFPGKALADINGKPMIQHVYEKALQSGAISVVIATDDERIRVQAQKFGANVCMTASTHQSGADRIAEAVTILGYGADEVIVNVQGDEPLIPPIIISQTAELLVSNSKADCATLCEPLEIADQLYAKNIAKVVLDANNFALYFSRAPIPWDRDNFPIPSDQVLPPKLYFRHLGIFCYRVSFLKKFVSWKPCAIELIECLEQLRMLWYGAKIYVGEAKDPSMVGVDTPEDLEKVLKILDK